MASLFPPSLLETTSPLLGAEESRAADAFTIETVGVPGIVLMEHAGRAISERAMAVSKGGHIVVVTGPGNNGGDGWVAARHLACRGASVEVVSLAPLAALKGDARTAANSWAAYCGRADALRPVATVLDDDDAAWTSLATALDRATVVVDALFGTGITRGLHGNAARLVKQINATRLCVIATDLPSGLPSDGSAPDGPVVVATQTLSFFARKIAHVAEPGFSYCGAVSVVDLTIVAAPDAPEATIRASGRTSDRTTSPSGIRAKTQASVRRPLLHKGSFGHVGVLAGAVETRGAARLSARAALRAGAGLCSILEERDAPSSAGDLVEVMRRDSDADTCLEGLHALVVGPGLGDKKSAIASAIALLSKRGKTAAVLDASILAPLFETGALHNDVVTEGSESSSARSTGAESSSSRSTGAIVLTPHPGEAARILSLGGKAVTAAMVQQDRLAAATALVATAPLDCVWVLKGAVPIVARGAARVLVPGGNEVLAVAGSGDVLAGAIAAHLARGDDAFVAAVEGTRRHQSAGARLAGRGALASEIADALMFTGGAS